MFQETNVGDAVYLPSSKWVAPVRCHAIGLAGDLLNV